MNTKLNRTVDRIGTFQAAWLENAPDAVFAGMTLEQFKEATKAPGELQEEILALVQQTARRKVESLKAMASVNEVLDLVVNSVKGTPKFGADSALYRSLGYVRKSERRTGLTRKSSAKSPSTDAV